MTSREEQQRRRIAEIMNHCVHFNGVQHSCCEAGVDYHAIHGIGQGCFAHLICFNDHESTATCDKQVFPTQEQAEQEMRESDERSQRCMKALSTAHDDAKAKGLKKGAGGTGECPCPICKGTIRYSVASYNGHMHAACTTPNCVSWME